MSKRNLFLYAALAAIFFIALAPAARAKPNFSGEWKLVADKSDFGPLPVPEKYIQKMEHADPDLKVTTNQVGQQGEATYDAKYTTDGKECANEVRGNPMKSTLKWDGDALLISTKAQFQGNDITLDDKWTMSEDGKTLTIVRKIAGGFGELENKLVLEKQ
jgi:hypothetical protein